MLKRIYIDNFRCLVDFELSVDEITFFAGRSGTGKSTVFDALRKIQAFVGGGQAREIFKPEDLTHFGSSPIQRFELEIAGNGGLYKYELATRHHNADVQVASERLWFDNQPLLNFQSGEGGGEGGAEETWFRERMKRFIIVQVVPPFMERVSSQAEAQLTARMENFVSWYRYVSQKPSKALEITNALKGLEIFEGLDYIKFSEANDALPAEARSPHPQGRNSKSYFLTLCFSGNGHSIEYGFHELADGERALIALYALIDVARSADITLCIDHPTHFIGLPTIEPWLKLLNDFCRAGELQALLISHHPLLIDDLALPAGYWFDRDEDDMQVRVRRFTDNETGGLPISQYVSRGWIHG